MRILAITVLLGFTAIFQSYASASSNETILNNSRIRGLGISISPEGAELGVVSAGTHNGSTLYTTKEDVGLLHWCTNQNGSTLHRGDENGTYMSAPIIASGSEYCSSSSGSKDIRATYATSASDGMENMEIIRKLTTTTDGLSLRNFPAMAACRQLGEDWYLPSIEEMKVLFDSRQDIGGFQTELPYWSSTEFPNYGARVMSFDDYGISRFESAHKSDALPVRCVAREKVSAR